MLLLFLSHLLSRNLLISDELFITKDLGVRKAQLEKCYGSLYLSLSTTNYNMVFNQETINKGITYETTWY
jgi:hypothetical protein